MPENDNSLEPMASDTAPEVDEISPRDEVPTRLATATRDPNRWQAGTQPTQEPEIDQATFRAAQRGDQSAIRAIVEVYWSRVARVAAAILVSVRGNGEVEDVVSLTFTYFFLKKLKDFDLSRPEPLSRYLYQKAIWLALKKCKPLRWELPPNDLADALNPEQIAVAREEREQVIRRFETLRRSQRIALSLWLDGLSYEEIAQVLGKSIPAVTGLLNRGRCALLEGAGSSLARRRANK